jgi:tRNA(Ile)-lysidine synthase
VSGVRVPAPPPLPPAFRTRLRRLEPILRSALRGACAVPRGGRLLVAVSGGADSTALLLALRNIAPEFGLAIAAAHLHHGLRGAEADLDQAFVGALCARIDVPLTSARWNTRLRMRRRGLTGEAGLRVLRREFLARAARRSGASAIVTAHTADDQLETLLMRLGRGAGISGLAGMRPRRGRWLKPLLLATRADIEADLVRAGQPWREDRSNRAPELTRNRIRHQAVPALVRALAPSADPARARALLARKAARIARDVGRVAEALESLGQDALPTICRIQPDAFALDSRRVASYASTARRLVLRQLWQRVDPQSTGLTDRQLQALSGLISSARAEARVDLAGGWIAERRRRWILIRRTGDARTPARARRGRTGARVEAELAQS